MARFPDVLTVDNFIPNVSALLAFPPCGVLLPCRSTKAMPGDAVLHLLPGVPTFASGTFTSKFGENRLNKEKEEHASHNGDEGFQFIIHKELSVCGYLMLLL